MFLAIGVVTGLAFWDEERESEAALREFGDEQSTLAATLGVTLGRRVVSDATASAAEMHPREILPAIDEIEKPSLVRVFLVPPAAADLVGSDGDRVHAPTIVDAARGTDRAALPLSRPDAALLGLLERSGAAGVRTVVAANGQRWSVVVAATARNERDRALRARWRLVLSVGLASGLVLAFGGYAMRRQRMQLALQHQLERETLERERNEKLVRADKLATMGAMATGIAHEVSTPLGVILARAEQLLPKQGDDRSKRAVEVIIEQTERIFVVIRGFLGLARGAQPMLARHDTSELAREAIDLVEHRFEKAGVALVADIDEHAPRVACEERLFEQVLVNLLLNACDACKPGGTVKLSVKRDGERVAFVVLDDGVGISPEALARATEPFFTTKPAGEGTGLGLAIAHEIVKHHGGTLALETRKDAQGTRASVELPVAKEES